jgi:hypothetical protein
MQSVSYTAVGSCSESVGNPKGTVTISTQPGLCSLVVMNGEELGLPFGGQFTGSAAASGYDITKGDWSLVEDEGNQQEGSVNDFCDATIGANGVINLQCTDTVCPADDCTGTQCNISDCGETLTPMQ